MTDPEKGLPIAAIRWKFLNSNSDQWVYAEDEKHGSELDRPNLEKLVRRSDVKALIQDRGFTIQQCIRKGRSEEAIEKLDELLEELEQ